MKFILLIVLCLSAYSNECDEQTICEGDKVFRLNSIRSVSFIESDNAITLAQDRNHYQTVVKLEDVSKSVRCYQELCVGFIVFFKNKIREIEFLDTTGRVVLKENTNYYQTFEWVSHLLEAYECYDNLCKGDLVKFSGRKYKVLYLNEKNMVQLEGLEQLVHRSQVSFISAL